MYVFVGFFCLFFIYWDFVKKNLLRVFEEKFECKIYMFIILGVFCLILFFRMILCVIFVFLVFGGF